MKILPDSSTSNVFPLLLINVPSSTDIVEYTSTGNKSFKSTIWDVEKCKGELKIIQL